MAKTVFRSFSWQKVTTQNVVRILISSYFIAFAIGVFPGTDVSVLLDQFLPAWISTFLTHLGVFTLAVMILTGVQRRAAALLLAIMVFWASYMILMSGPTVDVLGNFWRDLALIGALIMTYADADSYCQNIGGSRHPALAAYLAISIISRTCGSVILSYGCTFADQSSRLGDSSRIRICNGHSRNRCIGVPTEMSRSYRCSRSVREIVSILAGEKNVEFEFFGIADANTLKFAVLATVANSSTSGQVVGVAILSNSSRGTITAASNL